MISNTLILTTYSPENDFLYKLSLDNHVKYASTHRYDMLSMNVDYKEILVNAIEYVKYGLTQYQYVLLIGSDVLFTDIDRPLTSFIDNNYGAIISLETLGGSLCNFDLVLWQNNDKCKKLIDHIDRVKSNFINHPWGIQEIFNKMYNTDIGNSCVKYLPAGEFQSCPFNINNRYKWRAGDFTIHFLAMTNKQKYDNVKYFLEHGIPIYL